MSFIVQCLTAWRRVSVGANSHWTCQEILHTLRDVDHPCAGFESAPADPILRQLTSLHALKYCFFWSYLILFSHICMSLTLSREVRRLNSCKNVPSALTVLLLPFNSWSSFEPTQYVLSIPVRYYYSWMLRYLQGETEMPGGKSVWLDKVDIRVLQLSHQHRCTNVPYSYLMYLLFAL